MQVGVGHIRQTISAGSLRDEEFGEDGFGVFHKGLEWNLDV